MKGNKGAVAVIVGICIFTLVGFAALAIDIGHLILVRGELQNAADAGALAGAQVLFSFDGTDVSINTGANTTAQQVAITHLSDRISVDIASNDIQRGHWCFSCTDIDTGKKGVFTPNPSTDVVDLVGKTTEQLDVDTNFINAVRVYASRSDTPARSFFARIFGFQDFLMSAHAVAYRGFAGTLNPTDVDQPLAICNQAITDSNGFRCSVGKMLTNNSDTSAWTNFTQQPCATATPTTVSPSICNGNQTVLKLGVDVGTNNGVAADLILPDGPLINCWNSATGKVKPWDLVLPVIDCPSSIGPCEKVVGAVKVSVLWIRSVGADPNFNGVPTQMSDPWHGGTTWTCTGTDRTERKACWDSFVQNFGLEKSPGVLATSANDGYLQKTLYFRPSCEDATPTGVTGGQNFGILAKIPVLVK